MTKLTVAEIAKSYEGKPYNFDHMRRIASGYGDTGAVIPYTRLSKKDFDLFGITEALLNYWFSHGIFYAVFLDLDEKSQTITECVLVKRNNKGTLLTPTQQEVRIFRRIMDYITKG